MPAPGVYGLPGGYVGVGVAGAGAGLPAARPTLGTPDAPAMGLWVVNRTWGTVTWVEKTEVVKEVEMVWPAEGPPAG